MREAVVSFKLPNFDRAQLRCWLFVTVYWSAIAEAHRSRQMPRFTRKKTMNTRYSVMRSR